jgi:nucleoside-diphosphate-sugar epimerase
MKVFVTGATGYIGSVVVEKLIAAGHRPAGLARSDRAADKLASLGAGVVRGDLHDSASIAAGAAAADAAIHLAMEFSAAAPKLDRAAIDAILAGLGGAGKPLVYTSGIWVVGSTGDAGADEDSPVNPTPLVAWRPAHEQLVLRAPGVRGIVIRPAMVYGRGAGFVGVFQRSASAEGVVRYVGDGENRWPFVHVDDLADLYVLALGAPAGSLYFAAVGDSVKVKDVARAAARGARLAAQPLEEARRSIGPLADAVTLDQVIRSRKAQQELGWKPGRGTVLLELEAA